MAKSNPSTGDPDLPLGELGSSDGEDRLDSVRSILLAEERRRIDALEVEAENLREQDSADKAALVKEIDDLKAELEELRGQLDQESQSLIPRLISQMGLILSGAVQRSRESVSDALSPVMGDAIRGQIEDSQDEMIDALYPIILTTVQRAISEFARELQRNIDARLNATFGAQGAIRRLSARLRGVSDSELILRDALPFEIQELFLIQHESGLLIAQSRNEEGAADSDLISGMLTAIRDFAHDSFGEEGEEEELDEIQFGDERIIIQSGRYAYIAAVVQGIEPEGFHFRLQELLANLHQEYRSGLRDYDGDPALLPDLEEKLEIFVNESTITPEAPPAALSRQQRLVLIIAAIGGLLALACACFYLQFTIALAPLAFGDTPTPSPLPTESPLASATATATATPVNTPTSTPSPTPVPPTATDPPPTPTAVPTDTPMPTDTPVPSPTEEPPQSFTSAPVWVREAPALLANRINVIPEGTIIEVLGQSGIWVNVAWQSSTGLQTGWVPIQWVTLGQPIPAERITPAAGG